ncbi:Dehydrogenase xptC [Apiospora phragmitis]|uniref:Dehydrogenase xptC n=1 Tax=Apiospora phragmitis TaxID=2905665 RepID=A0ABR1TB74_9PEZI
MYRHRRDYHHDTKPVVGSGRHMLLENDLQCAKIPHVLRRGAGLASSLLGGCSTTEEESDSDCAWANKNFAMMPVVLRSVLLLGVLQTLALAVPDVAAKRQATQLRDQYDFVILGGGTAGLSVADRLSKAFPAIVTETILVIEYGDIEYGRGFFDLRQVEYAPGFPGASSWTFTSLPSPHVANKTATVVVGKVVGGSSCVNGQFFVRGSRLGFDVWYAPTGIEVFDQSEHRWNWEGLFPYFKKVTTGVLQSVTFTAPPETSVKAFGYTWDDSWADFAIVRDALKELDIPIRQGCAGGDKTGLCWVPTSQHPTTSRRSHSGLGHYAAVNATRDNYDLLVRHQALRVLGFGPADVLRKAGISAVVDLPAKRREDTKPLGLSPLPSDMYDPAFIADATAGFDETPARGPYTLDMRNKDIYIPLANMPVDFDSIITTIKQQLAQSPADNTALYFPLDVSTSPALTAGYQYQLALLLALHSNASAPSLEVLFGGGTSLSTINLHPFSCGRVRLNATHPLEPPVLDFRAGSNPLCIAISVAHLRYLRRVIDTPTLRARGAVEVAPGADAATTAQLADYVGRSRCLI